MLIQVYIVVQGQNNVTLTYIMQKILIIKPSSLGDIIHALEIVNLISEYLPHVEVTWVAREIFVPFVEVADNVHKVLTFERKGGILGFFKLVKQIREQEFDYVLDMQGLARSALLTFFARAKKKIGRADSRECAFLAYNEIIELPEEGKNAHALEILLQFLPKLGIPFSEPNKLTFSKLDNVSENIPQAFSSKDTLVLFPDSRRPEKEWPKYVELTNQLLTEYPNLKVVWAGQGRLKQNPLWPADRFYNLLSKTTLSDLILLIRNARCIISNDSGPMHLAAAMGVELIALFGPTSPKLFGPYPLDRKTHHVIEAPQGSLHKLTVEQVMKKLEEIL